MRGGGGGGGGAAKNAAEKTGGRANEIEGAALGNATGTAVLTALNVTSGSDGRVLTVTAGTDCRLLASNACAEAISASLLCSIDTVEQPLTTQ